jgi:murein DD-endopeptidase MepM/ murein hydrolase activator NlpD
MAPLVSPLTGTLKSIKKQFIAKEKLVKSSLVTQRKKADNNRKNSERERSIDYERLLERKLGFLGKPVRSVGRKIGFIESLKKFIVNVLLGFVTVRLLKYLPQLKNVLSTMLSVGNFIIDMSGKLLNGLVTFVDKGYQAADHARTLIRNVGGEDALKSFDKLSDQSNSLLNSIMIAGMMFTDFGGVGRASVSSGKAIDTGIDVIKDTLTKEAGNQVAKQAARTAVAPLGAAGIVLGAGLLASAVGEGAFQIKKLGKGLQGWLGGKVTEASQDKNPVTRFLKKGFFGWMQATLGPAIWLLNGTGVLFDIVGAPFRYGIELIRAAYMKLNDDRRGLEQQNKNLGKFDARIRDGIREHFSILSPLFNFVGMKGVSSKLQTPGSFGSLYGEKSARDMGYYRGGMVVKKFAGGGYAGEEKEKKITVPRTLKEDPGAIKPGSAVGGYQALVKVFPNPGETGRMNQYGYMNKSYVNISQYMGSLGPLMSLTTKSLLGDKVETKDYKNASDSLSSFLMLGISEENPLAYQKLNSVIETDTLKSVIEGEVSSLLRDKIGEIRNLLRVQVGLAPLPGPATGSESDPCAAVCETPSSSGSAVSGDAVDKAILDLISSVEAKDYDTMNVSRGATAGKPTQMTVDWLSANANGAVGRYQQMPEYLKERVIAAGGKGTDKFTPELQDRTALKMLYSGHGFARWRSGQMSDEEFGNRLSATWRGLPHSSGGTYPDQYAGRNKAHMSRPAFMSRLAQIKAGAGGSTMAKIAPGSPAASVDPCICDPDVPNGDPGNLPPPVKQPSGGHIVTSEMGMRGLALSPGMHMGVDISGNVGEYLKAFTSGTVEATGYDGGYGNYVNWIDSFGVAHFYAHMNKPAFVKRGQKVNPGTVLGILGSTGRSSGPHLHWEAATNPRDTGMDKSRVLSRFNPLSRYSKESPFTGSRQSGGPTLSGGTRILHKGEYVIDKDSVELFGGQKFFSLINQVENDDQRTKAASQLINHLSQYTGRKLDQRPEVVIDNSGDTFVMSPPVVMPSLISSGGSSTGEVNWEQDMCYARG